MSRPLPSTFTILLQVLLLASAAALSYGAWLNRQIILSDSMALEEQQDRKEAIVKKFTEAAEQGDNATLLNLLSQGVPVDATHAESEFTALMQACRTGHLETVRLLLDKGAKINLKTPMGYTPLEAAMMGSHANVARFLMEKGVDIKQTVSGGRTVLECAVLIGDVALAKELIRRGADVNQADRYGYRPLVWTPHNLPLLKLLLDHGADPNATSDYENTAFMSIVTAGDIPGARLMLSRGANINYIGRYGRTALDYALENNDKAMIAFLKRAGARDGMTQRRIPSARRK